MYKSLRVLCLFYNQEKVLGRRRSPTASSLLPWSTDALAGRADALAVELTWPVELILGDGSTPPLQEAQATPVPTPTPTLYFWSCCRLCCRCRPKLMMLLLGPMVLLL